MDLHNLQLNLEQLAVGITHSAARSDKFGEDDQSMLSLMMEKKAEDEYTKKDKKKIGTFPGGIDAAVDKVPLKTAAPLGNAKACNSSFP